MVWSAGRASLRLNVLQPNLSLSVWRVLQSRVMGMYCCKAGGGRRSCAAAAADSDTPRRGPSDLVEKVKSCY